jgi:agmatine deiminase
MMIPKERGYYFPAEWCNHKATWLSYPHNEVSFPDKINSIYPGYFAFIREIAKKEEVHINVVDETMMNKVLQQIQQFNVPTGNVIIHIHPTNDAWCRDHGPAFLINPSATVDKKIIVNWNYNAWGNKYPFELDNKIPMLIANYYNMPYVNPGIVMEGGSVDFNGDGTVITTSACLLHENRNPQLNQAQIEKYLIDFYGVEQVLWLGEGIDGDDTNGHVDDITRFIANDAVITMVEPDKNDVNHFPLQENLKKLKKMRLVSGKQLDIIEIPMPDPVIYDGQRLPASYANFYFSNEALIVPTYQCANDGVALEILSSVVKDRKIIGIDSTEIIWGLGSFHCLSQQEPGI